MRSLLLHFVKTKITTAGCEVLLFDLGSAGSGERSESTPAEGISSKHQIPIIPSNKQVLLFDLGRAGSDEWNESTPAKSLFKYLIINKLAIFTIANFFYAVDFQLLTTFNIFSFQFKLTCPKVWEREWSVPLTSAGIMEWKFQTLGLGSRHFGGEVLYLKWSATEWIGNVLSGLIPQSHLFGEHKFFKLWKAPWMGLFSFRFWYWHSWLNA